MGPSSSFEPRWPEATLAGAADAVTTRDRVLERSIANAQGYHPDQATHLERIRHTNFRIRHTSFRPPPSTRPGVKHGAASRLSDLGHVRRLNHHDVAHEENS